MKRSCIFVLLINQFNNASNFNLMATFSEPTQVLTIKKDGQSIVINRVTKLGTSRVFFYPTFEGKRITNTNYGRQYDAKTLGMNYLKYLKSKNA